MGLKKQTKTSLNLPERERERDRERERERGGEIEIEKKLTNLAFCEKITNLTLHIKIHIKQELVKRTQQALPSVRSMTPKSRTYTIESKKVRQ